MVIYRQTIIACLTLFAETNTAMSKKIKDDKKKPLVQLLMFPMASVVAILMTSCVAAVPVAAPVHHYSSAAMHTSHAANTYYDAHPRPVAVVPVVRPVAPIARAASPVGVHGTARRTSRRVTRRH